MGRSLLTLLLFVAGCQCQSSLPTDDDGGTAGTDAPKETGETGDPVEKPCDNPELEPNNAQGESSVLPMEVESCGTFGAPGDFDFWSFETTMSSWIAVRLRTESLGSYADPAMTLSSDQGDAAQVAFGLQTRDRQLIFPAKAAKFSLLLTEEQSQGAEDDRYAYELIASVVKPPINQTANEVEPNDGKAQANLILDGSLTWGVLQKSSDSDWYRIEVPAGKHQVSVVVRGFALGSAADTVMFLYTEDLEPIPSGCSDCGYADGPQGWEPDPTLSYASIGDETLYLRVSEEFNRGGTPFWYVLDTKVEGAP